MDSDYIVQIDIDPVAKDSKYDFTTEKEICDTYYGFWMGRSW